MESIDSKIEYVRNFMREVISGDFAAKFPSNLSSALKARLDFEDVVSRLKSSNEYIKLTKKNNNFEIEED